MWQIFKILYTIKHCLELQANILKTHQLWYSVQQTSQNSFRFVLKICVKTQIKIPVSKALNQTTSLTSAFFGQREICKYIVLFFILCKLYDANFLSSQMDPDIFCAAFFTDYFPTAKTTPMIEPCLFLYWFFTNCSKFSILWQNIVCVQRKKSVTLY